jgi:hypothetical protein
LPAPGSEGVPGWLGGVEPGIIKGVIDAVPGSLPITPEVSPPGTVPAISVPFEVPDVVPELFKNDETAKTVIDRVKTGSHGSGQNRQVNECARLSELSVTLVQLKSIFRSA